MTQAETTTQRGGRRGDRFGVSAMAHDVTNAVRSQRAAPSKTTFTTDGTGHARQRRLDRVSLAVLDIRREVAFDVAEVDRYRLPEFLFARVRERDVQTPPIAWTGESLHQPGLHHTVDEPRQTALAEQERARELAHRQALAGSHPQLGKGVEPGERQATGRFELPSEDVFQRLVRREKRAPGIEPRGGHGPGRRFSANDVHRSNLSHCLFCGPFMNDLYA